MNCRSSRNTMLKVVRRTFALCQEWTDGDGLSEWIVAYVSMQCMCKRLAGIVNDLASSHLRTNHGAMVSNNMT